MGVKDSNQLLFKGGAACKVPASFDTVLVDGSFVKMLSMSIAATIQDRIFTNVSTHVLYQDMVMRAAIISRNKLQPVCKRLNESSKIIIYVDNHVYPLHDIKIDLPDDSSKRTYWEIIKKLYIPNVPIKSNTWDKRAKGSKILFHFTDHDEVLYDSQFRELLKKYRELFLDKINMTVSSINEIKYETDDEDLKTKFRDWLIMENYLVCNPFINNFYPSALTAIYANILRQILPNATAYVSNSETDFEITKYVSAHQDEKICIVSSDTDYSFYNGYIPNVYIYDLRSYKHPYSAWLEILDKELITRSMLLRISHLLGNDYFEGFIRNSHASDAPELSMKEDLYKVLNVNGSFASCGENPKKTISNLYNDSTKFLVTHKKPFTPHELDLIIIASCEDDKQREQFVTSLMVLENINDIISDEGLIPINYSYDEMASIMQDTLKTVFPLLYKFKHSPITLREIIANDYKDYIQSCNKDGQYEHKYNSASTKDIVLDHELTKDFPVVCKSVIRAINTFISPLVDGDELSSQ